MGGGVYSEKDGNKSLEDKYNSNEFPFSTFKRGSFTPAAGGGGGAQAEGKEKKKKKEEKKERKRKG